MNFRNNSEHTALPLNILPLVDILLVLCVFLMGMWAATEIERQLSLKLPVVETGDSQGSAAAALKIIVNVTANGQISVNKRNLTDPQLMSMLADLITLDPKQVVILRGDRTVPYERILQVLDMCRKAGVEDIAFSGIPREGSTTNQLEP